MRKRRVWLWLLVMVLSGAALAAFLEPTGTVRGLLAREPFYRGRPVRYWREVLRQDGRNGSITGATVGRFWGAHTALPVLRACAHDSDRNVRWPAVALLGHGGLRTQQVLDILVEALEDGDIEVRLKAVGALAEWGPMARPAIPALTERLKDQELQVAHHADLALWQIDAPAAVAACGWRPFTSPEFGFSAVLPEQPEREDKQLFDGQAIAHSFQAWHRMGSEPAPTRYVILVAEYSEEVLKGSTDEERFQATKDLAPLFFHGGKVVEEKQVSRGGLNGREYLLDVEGIGQLRSRQFWVGRKLYTVMVAYKPQFLNPRAAAYFLDSFRPEQKPAVPATHGLEGGYSGSARRASGGVAVPVPSPVR
jgi:hypothetical protein